MVSYCQYCEKLVFLKNRTYCKMQLVTAFRCIGNKVEAKCKLCCVANCWHYYDGSHTLSSGGGSGCCFLPLNWDINCPTSPRGGEWRGRDLCLPSTPGPSPGNRGIAVSHLNQWFPFLGYFPLLPFLLWRLPALSLHKPGVPLPRVLVVLAHCNASPNFPLLPSKLFSAPTPIHSASTSSPV